MNDETIPDVVQQFAERYPDVWNAYNQLGEAAGKFGPLDSKTQRLIKLGIAIGAARQGAVNSHARRALKEGITPDELRQTAVLGITTVGWPAAFSSFCWIEENLED